MQHCVDIDVRPANQCIGLPLHACLMRSFCFACLLLEVAISRDSLAAIYKLHELHEGQPAVVYPAPKDAWLNRRRRLGKKRRLQETVEALGGMDELDPTDPLIYAAAVSQASAPSRARHKQAVDKKTGNSHDTDADSGSSTSSGSSSSSSSSSRAPVPQKATKKAASQLLAPTSDEKLALAALEVDSCSLEAAISDAAACASHTAGQPTASIHVQAGHSSAFAPIDGTHPHELPMWAVRKLDLMVGRRPLLPKLKHCGQYRLLPYLGMSFLSSLSSLSSSILQVQVHHLQAC